ncbi:hypothetical protein BKA58DRAFT_383246 [Alternaria rosae]|uniref:uncharacterized protein n=1 Tax=Alternaria rosae TaxID=1187941 RepID=UPI001E8CFAC3|nr:uncharacterized protein BKA58DRAFT_383246 [Alternaria rosae]KAH6872997.1 hypothetical protein BKA58DRAFT_383246 [Alternaria rosae]
MRGVCSLLAQPLKTLVSIGCFCWATNICVHKPCMIVIDDQCEWSAGNAVILCVKLPRWSRCSFHEEWQTVNE